MTAQSQAGAGRGHLRCRAVGSEPATPSTSRGTEGFEQGANSPVLSARALTLQQKHQPTGKQVAPIPSLLADFLAGCRNTRVRPQLPGGPGSVPAEGTASKSSSPGRLRTAPHKCHPTPSEAVLLLTLSTALFLASAPTRYVLSASTSSPQLHPDKAFPTQELMKQV